MRTIQQSPTRLLMTVAAFALLHTFALPVCYVCEPNAPDGYTVTDDTNACPEDCFQFKTPSGSSCHTAVYGATSCTQHPATQTAYYRRGVCTLGPGGNVYVCSSIGVWIPLDNPVPITSCF